jgi:hypothetical protein
MSIADVSEAAILNLIFKATPWANYADNAASAPETNIVCAMHTADPGEAGTMATNETTYTSYARVNVVRSAVGWTVTSGPGTCVPAAAINFPTGTGGSGTITYGSVGKSGGGASPILFSGTVTPNIVAGNGVTPQFTTGSAFSLD